MDEYKLYTIARKHYLKGNIFIAKFITKLNGLIHNSHIPYTAEIGEKSCFSYGGIGIVIHDNAIIGKHCTIGQGVTIGGRTGHGGPPIIGDNVYIGPGARLLGEFKVGNNVVIGSNAVIIHDIPDNSVAAGIPAKVIKTDVNKWKEAGII